MSITTKSKSIRNSSLLATLVFTTAAFIAQAANADDNSAFEATTDGNANAAINLTGPTPLTAISIDILTELKADTTTVNASSPAVPSIDGFWVQFAGPTWTKAVVTISPKATGLIESSITLIYLKPTGFTGTFYAPFSISEWTGSASGTGTATVTFWNGSILLGGANHTFTLLHN